jgi:thymidylate synthase (FAD)
MSAKLISYSQNEDNDTLLDQIAYCARVSNPSNQSNSQTSEKLVRYLIKEGHWSPLEMVSACVEINTTRDIARQILRHRSFSFQEFSQRYADPTDDLEMVVREARLQDTKNRQNSIDIEDDNDVVNKHLWKQSQESLIYQSKSVYKWAIEQGIAKEQARAVLPEGLMGSRMYMNGTLRSWVHYIELRSGNGTQKEHMEIARQCAEALEPVFPMIKEFISE